MTKFYIPMMFPFVDEAHRVFFEDFVYEFGRADAGDIAAVYLLSATPETRREFWSLVDADGHIKDDCWEADWQTPDTRRCIALAVNLTYGDTYPELSPAVLYDSLLRPVFATAVYYWYENSYSA